MLIVKALSLFVIVLFTHTIHAELFAFMPSDSAHLDGPSVKVVATLNQDDGEEYYLITPKRNDHGSDLDFKDTIARDYDFDPQGSSYEFLLLAQHLGESTQKYIGVSEVSERYLIIPSPKTIMQKFEALKAIIPDIFISFSLAETILDHSNYLASIMSGKIPLSTAGKMLHHDLNYHVVSQFVIENEEYKSALDKINILILFKQFLHSQHDQELLRPETLSLLIKATDQVIKNLLLNFDLLTSSKDTIYEAYCKQKIFSSEEYILDKIADFFDEALIITYTPTINKRHYSYTKPENNSTSLSLDFKKLSISRFETCINSTFINLSSLMAFKDILSRILIIKTKNIITYKDKHEDVTKDSSISLFLSHYETNKKIAPGVDKHIEELTEEFLTYAREQRDLPGFHYGLDEIPPFKSFKDTVTRIEEMNALIKDNFQSEIELENKRIEAAKNFIK